MGNLRCVGLCERDYHRAVRRVLIPVIVLPLLVGDGVSSTARVLEAQESSRNDSLGIAHISYGNGTFSADRYRFAQQAGVGWNRWVFYWNEIERSPGVFDYRPQDATVAADNAQGLRILGILMGTPVWSSGDAATASAILAPQPGQRSHPTAADEETRLLSAASPIIRPPPGLFDPVFSDGSDTPGPGKAINPANFWARFANQTASRYRGRVHAWEIWNEPDFPATAETGWFGFWSGTVDDYARLLKVAYLSIKAADPSATVVMGGMMHFVQPTFFPGVLSVLRADPSASEQGFYFDATAWHWYSRAGFLWEKTFWVKRHLGQQGMAAKPIWVTETTLPVCGDVIVDQRFSCTVGSSRGTPEYQAAFVIQAIAYGRAAGVEKIFIFQLYDDLLGPGEYFGLVRNNGVPRPALAALSRASALLRPGGFAYRTASGRGQVELVTIGSPGGRRARVVWNQGGSGITVGLPIDDASVQLLDPLSGQPRQPSSATLASLALAPATLNDNPQAPPDYIVGGPPLFALDNPVLTQPGRIEGTVRDPMSRPLAGIPVRAGFSATATNSQGRYDVDLLPGLYDVAPDPGGPFPISGPAGLSVPVWAGRSSTHDLGVRPSHYRFVPIGLFRHPG